MLYFNELGLVTSIYKQKSHYIPWEYVEDIHESLVAGVPYNNTNSPYPVNREQASFILAYSEEYAGIKLSVKPAFGKAPTWVTYQDDNRGVLRLK